MLRIAPTFGKKIGATVGYMGPESGPFDCAHCKHYIKANRCNQSEVVEELGEVEKGLAKVQPAGCCNEFDPKGK